MRALITDPAAPGGLRLGETPDPVPAPDEALVRVTATSLNHGEASLARQGAPAGAVLGWDAAGVVVRPADDGSSPPAGTPVITLGMAGAWAEQRAVNTGMMGTVAEGADPGAISTIPVAGLSALRALRRLGPVLGRRVLITGATGGVGRYAVQLARLAGAHVVASTGDPAAHGDALRSLGADEVVAGPDDVDEPVCGVLDLVGGHHLVAAYDRLAPGGTLVAVGRVTGEGETFPYAMLSGDRGHDRSIVSFYLPGESGLGPDLTWLAAKVASGVLTPQISWRGPWAKAAEAMEALLERRLHGKAVLDIT
ncbi:zinc-binding dehydrogenase [Nonomuraea sp. MCN248]|uniref:Zinc-binding dehydrogenase n=1 Tax=Nonomuraea corallina TaxID=2989783 RepID=A0ABT4SCR3_9ACTN|nr:zinc-binding dehydrogenase [Nonomuraea corallina]MDA0634994.1 zinc-binding dehydrogenase [Nonomuraea corallina]